MRQFRLLKGATILNIIFGMLTTAVLLFIGVVGIIIALEETTTLKPVFDLFGAETSDKISLLLDKVNLNGGRITRDVLADYGLHSLKIPSIIFKYQVSTILMVVGFVGAALAFLINIYGSTSLLRNIKGERFSIGRVNKFKAFFISILSIPFAPVAALFMLLGTLFARPPVVSKEEGRIQYRQRNPYGPMV